jgi:hypothetical protein
MRFLSLLLVFSFAAWSMDTELSSATSTNFKQQKFHQNIERILDELAGMYGGRVVDLGQSFIMTSSDNQVDLSSPKLKKLIAEVSGFEANSYALTYDQYMRFLSILSSLIEKLHTQNKLDAGSHEIEQDINNFIMVAKLIGDYQKYDPSAVELKSLLLLTKNISLSLEKLIGTNNVSPFTFDFFDDLDKQEINDYITSIEKKTSASSIYANKRETITAGFPAKDCILLREDHKGNLIITIGESRGLNDLSYDISKQIAFSNLFQLNGVASVFKNAEFYYDLLDKHFYQKNIVAAKSLIHTLFENYLPSPVIATAETKMDPLESYLARGKKIRLIGHGFDGMAAEIITHKLKVKYASLNHVTSDVNQIQAITFGTFGYLDKSSLRQFKEKVGNNILRFRFIKDAVKDYADSVPLDEVFIVGDAVKNVPYSSTYHELQYFQGNLVNVNVIKNFKRYLLLYKLVKVEHEVLASIVDKTDDQEVAYYLTQLNNLKRGILNYYYSNSSNNSLSLFASIKIACDALASVVEKSHGESTVIQSIAHMVANKEVLAKRSGLDLKGATGEEATALAVFELVKGLQGEDAQKAFGSIIARIGQSPAMLVSYASYIKTHHEIDVIKELIKYLIAVEKKVNAPQLAGIQKEKEGRLNKYLEAMAMSKLNLLAGGSFKEAGGATGTKFTLDVYGKIIGIFKLKGQNAMIKQYFGQAALLSSHELAQPISECAAYKLSLDLGLNLAPVTIKTKFKVAGSEVEGAFMELLENARELDDIVTKRPSDSFLKNEITRFQFMVIFDFLIANLDRHLGNLFIRASDLTTLMCIDNANAFITCGPNQVNGHNMYKWESYGIAQATFQPEVLSWIAEYITEDSMGQFQTYITNTYPGFLTNAIVDFLTLRVKVLRNLSTHDSPAALAKLKTRTLINEWLDGRANN